MSSTIYVGKYIDSGSKNTFYHIVGSNRQYGFKAFPTKDKACWSYNVQKELSLVTAAPFVASEVGRITLKETNELSGWGYITEVATKVRYCNRPNCCCDRWNSEKGCKNLERINELTDIMDSMGLCFTDGHIANFGMVKRKDKKIMVLIDTGVEGFDDWDETIWGTVERYRDYYDDECGCSECVANRGSNA